jgi:hypothetical protein
LLAFFLVPVLSLSFSQSLKLVLPGTASRAFLYATTTV